MQLIFIYGPPAAGKLTVATELARLTGYRLLDNHKAIDYLAEIFPRQVPHYAQIRSELGRSIRLDIFAAAAKLDINLITTFAPLSPGAQDFMRDSKQTVEAHGGSVYFVHLLPTQEAMLQRVVESSRHNRKIDTVKRWHEAEAAAADLSTHFPDVEHFTLDNTLLPPQAAATAIVAHYKLAD